MCHNYHSFKSSPANRVFYHAGQSLRVHYLVFAKLMALPLHFSYLYFFRIGFYISKPVRYDKSFSFLLSFKKR